MIFTHYPIFSASMTATLLGAGLVALVRKWVPVHFLATHHEVAFPIFLQIGVIYGVLLAFVFSMVVNEVGESYNEIKVETTNLLTLAQLAPGFSPAERKMIDDTLIDYTRTVINGEWPKMAQHQEDVHVTQILDRLQKIYLNLDLKSPRQEAIYSNSLEHLGQLRESRRVRIFAATITRLNNPLVLLTALGFIVVGISYFFGMHRVWVQMVLTGALIFTISSILMVILLLNNPFSGKFSIPTRLFDDALVRLQQIAQE